MFYYFLPFTKPQKAISQETRTKRIDSPKATSSLFGLDKPHPPEARIGVLTMKNVIIGIHIK